MFTSNLGSIHKNISFSSVNDHDVDCFVHICVCVCVCVNSYFLQSALKRLNAAPPLPLLMLLFSCAASTPDSTEPWSLYDTLLADIPSIYPDSQRSLQQHNLNYPPIKAAVFKQCRAAIFHWMNRKKKKLFDSWRATFPLFHAESEVSWSHMTVTWRQRDVDQTNTSLLIPPFLYIVFNVYLCFFLL